MLMKLELSAGPMGHLDLYKAFTLLSHVGDIKWVFYVCEADSDCLWTVISFLVFVWVHKSLVFKLFIELIQSACICFV